MLLIVVYIVGCFLCGLWLKGRRLAWMAVGGAALVCVIYLATDQSFLSGFSISSLSTGETHAPASEAPPLTDAARQGPGPGVSSTPPHGDSIITAVYTWVQRFDGRQLAAGLAFALLLAGLAATLLQPRHGLYLVLFFTLVGDAVLLPWYPFVKGFSSRESLSFVHDALIISPLEIYIALIAISWAVRQVRQSGLTFQTGPLFWPAMGFLAFVVVGFAYGVGTGGDLRIALWEARPVSYLIALMLLTSTLVRTPAQASRVLWVVVMAVFLKGINGSLYYLVVLQGDLSGVERISEHAAAIHLNFLFIASLAVWIYKASRMKRLLLPLAIPCVLLGYIAMQRRAAFVTLAIALALAVAVLSRENRRLFWIGAPALVLLSVGYVAMFWHSQSTLAVPAQAIKSVIAARLASAQDQSSNNYRVIENRNINVTIHEHPLGGIGFGQKFHIVDPMPDISHLFDWWEYITHNSILWIWMKAGIGGFFSMLCLIGLGVAGGVRALERLRDPDLRAVTMTATLYIVVHFIYACVDMSWDAGSTVLVGTMMGIVNSSGWIEAGRSQ